LEWEFTLPYLRRCKEFMPLFIGCNRRPFMKKIKNITILVLAICISIQVNVDYLTKFIPEKPYFRQKIASQS